MVHLYVSSEWYSSSFTISSDFHITTYFRTFHQTECRGLNLCKLRIRIPIELWSSHRERMNNARDELRS